MGWVVRRDEILFTDEELGREKAALLLLKSQSFAPSLWQPNVSMSRYPCNYD